MSATPTPKGAKLMTVFKVQTYAGFGRWDDTNPDGSSATEEVTTYPTWLGVSAEKFRVVPVELDWFSGGGGQADAR